MMIKIKPYSVTRDYQRVYEFLDRLYSLDRPPCNWSPQRWEYMHFHRLFEKVRSKSKNFGLWIDQNRLVAVAHFEHQPGEIYFEIDPDYAFLKKDLFDYAEKKLGISANKGQKQLKMYLPEQDGELNQLAKKHGYQREVKKDELVSLMKIEPQKLRYKLPAGFQIQGLAGENDLKKLHQLLHRGFDHPGEPDWHELGARKRMEQAPHFRKDLNLITIGPRRQYVSYCGGWLESKKHYVYIEPVCTDPDYRLKGLGKATVWEMIKRAHQIGARKAIVGSGKKFYRQLGFKYFFKKNCWQKNF